MKINEVEKQTGISSTNIRYYEQKELLVPRRSSDNNYRVYSNDDIERLKQIKILRMIGIPISEIKEILDEKKSLKNVMTIRINQITEEEENLAAVKTLCQNIVEYDMDIHMLNENLLEENRELWKKKLAMVNIEEKAQYLRRKSAIILCILAIIFCFFPVIPVNGSALNIFLLVLHPDFIWTIGSILALLIYLLIPVVYLYVLHGYTHYKNHVNYMIYPTFAAILSVLAQVFLALIITIQMPDFIIEDNFVPTFIGVLGAICRFLTGFLLVIDCVSGEELFVRVLKKRAK